MAKMLKIRDDIDLKELEKYGFVRTKSIMEYKRKIDNNWWDIIVIDEDREIFEMIEDFGWWRVIFSDEHSFNKKSIKDLMKAGLIEEVKGED